MHRAMADVYSELEKLGAKHYTTHQHSETVVPRLVKCFSKVVGFSADERLLVIGCGPNPQAILEFAAFGFDVVGVEPIAAYVDSANAKLQHSAVRLGDAEHLPFQDG